jgi:hypothetical protein
MYADVRHVLSPRSARWGTTVDPSAPEVKSLLMPEDERGSDMAGNRTASDDTKLAAMVDSIWEHREELARMAQELPLLLQQTGDQMREAGQRAQQASVHLAGDVREYTGHAADMLEASKHQLRAVLQALEKAGGMLKNLPFIGDMGKVMGDQLGAIGDVADNLDVVGQKVRKLGDRLGDVGGDLEAMGASLAGGGARLVQFGAPTTAAPVKKAPAKKAPAKKAPAKKAPAAAVGKRAAASTPALSSTAAKKTAATVAKKAPTPAKADAPKAKGKHDAKSGKKKGSKKKG